MVKRIDQLPKKGIVIETYTTLLNLSVLLAVIGLVFTCAWVYFKQKNDPHGIYRATGLSVLMIHIPIAIYTIVIGVLSLRFIYNYQPPSPVLSGSPILSDQEAVNLLGEGLGLYIGSISAILFGGLYLIGCIITGVLFLSEKLLRKCVY